MKKKVLVGVAVFAAGALLAAGIVLWPRISVNIDRPYVAVYMETGDVYFGKLSRTPRMTLSDVYVVQAGIDPEDPERQITQVVPFSVAPWGPTTITLNDDKIVFIGEVGNDSQIMRAIQQHKGQQQ